MKKIELEGKSATADETIAASDIASCQSLCSNSANCEFFNYDSNKKACSLLSSIEGIKENSDVVSGASECAGLFSNEH